MRVVCDIYINIYGPVLASWPSQLRKIEDDKQGEREVCRGYCEAGIKSSR